MIDVEKAEVNNMSIENINKINSTNYLNNKPTVGTANNLSNFAQVLNQINAANQAVNSATDSNELNGAQGKNTQLNTDLEDIFARASEAYNVPENLLKAVAKAESGFNPNAVSKCGAMGVMQLMPATAKSLGVTDAYDAEQNIMAGAKYLSQKLQTYNGDVTLALASYNAGSGNVAKYGGVPPFPETQNYISKILGYMGQDVEIPQQINLNTGSGNLSGLLGSNSLSFSQLGAEKAYYMSQLQIMNHQMEMQALFASNMNGEDENDDSNFDNLTKITNLSNFTQA